MKGKSRSTSQFIVDPYILYAVIINNKKKKMKQKEIDLGRTRTCNLLIRSQMLYPIALQGQLVSALSILSIYPCSFLFKRKYFGFDLNSNSLLQVPRMRIKQTQ